MILDDIVRDRKKDYEKNNGRKAIRRIKKGN